MGWLGTEETASGDHSDADLLGTAEWNAHGLWTAALLL